MPSKNPPVAALASAIRSTKEPDFHAEACTDSRERRKGNSSVPEIRRESAA
jgi:hypothetical protein